MQNNLSTSKLYQRLKFIRINLKKISVFYTHTKIEYTHIKLLKEIKHLFVMNSTEINNLKVFGLEEKKLELFTTGYDEKLFNRKDKERDIDFLFVCKFVDKDKQYYYWNRKNMDLLVNLAEKLRQKGYKVLVMGKTGIVMNSFLNFRLWILSTVNILIYTTEAKYTYLPHYKKVVQFHG